MRLPPILPAIAVLGLHCASPAPAPGSPASSPDAAAASAEPVRVDILLAAPAPDGGRWLAVRFRLEPGWHVYWENPGDSGLATRARIAAPAGVGVGPVLYPGPERFESPGDVTSYGYEGEAGLLAELRPEAAAAGGGKVVVEASWLACKDVCIPGRARVERDLEAPGYGDEPHVARYRSRLPRPVAELERAAIAIAGDDSSPELAVRVADAEHLEFFPGARPALAFTAVELVPDGADLTLKAALRRLETGDATPWHGVLLVRRGGAPTYYALDARAGSGSL